MGLLLALVLGLCVWVGFAFNLKDNGRLEFEANVASFKGSPYGKVLALAMQGPIGLYFHKGESHETSEALKEPHVHADGSICHEDHGNEEAEESSPPLSHHRRAKDQIKKMAAYAHRNTSSLLLSPEHEKYLQSENEDMLRLAYELDPSNYTNYNNYHLFISMNDFGKSAMNQEAAVALARRTILFCQRETVDPASWLTAASAAYNVITYVGLNYEKLTKKQAKASLFEFDECMKTYEMLLDASQKKSLYIPDARLKEMKSRARFLRKLREAQGIYMKRMMVPSHPSEPTHPLQKPNDEAR